MPSPGETLRQNSGLTSSSSSSIFFFSLSYAGPLGWLNFRGEWGNSKNGCDLEPLSGECRLNHGPIFPGGPDDMPPPRIQRSRQTVTTLAPPPLPSPPPHYLIYTSSVPQLARQQAPAGRASGILNYRYKRRDPASSGSVPVAANTGADPDEPNDDSGSDPDANLANRLVTSAPEDSSTTSP